MTHIENYAFVGSKLKSLIVENCECIEKNAFLDECNVKVHCGKLNLDNVKNCTKVLRVLSDKQKTL